MNRRGFLTAILAAPLAGFLPTPAPSPVALFSNAHTTGFSNISTTPLTAESLREFRDTLLAQKAEPDFYICSQEMYDKYIDPR